MLKEKKMASNRQKIEQLFEAAQSVVSENRFPLPGKFRKRDELIELLDGIEAELESHGDNPDPRAVQMRNKLLAKLDKMGVGEKELRRSRDDELQEGPSFKDKLSRRFSKAMTMRPYKDGDVEWESSPKDIAHKVSQMSNEELMSIYKNIASYLGEPDMGKFGGGSAASFQLKSIAREMRRRGISQQTLDKKEAIDWDKEFEDAPSNEDEIEESLKDTFASMKKMAKKTGSAIAKAGAEMSSPEPIKTNYKMGQGAKKLMRKK